MTLQGISGSDYFHPVHWTSTSDLGTTWKTPAPIAGLGRKELKPNWFEGVCDVVPEYHQKTDTVVAIGHNVYYQSGRLARPQGPRWPVYTVRDAGGNWSTPQKLDWDDPRGSRIYTCGCGQRQVLPDGDLLIAFCFYDDEKRPDRRVTTVCCEFDGKTIRVKQTGSTLELPVKRGLLEPQLIRFDGRYRLSIRAEDGHGYQSISDDGLNWEPIRPWSWDDGTLLTMSTTQQHWLAHSDGLFLVYTRRTEANRNVFRWRAPLFVTQVDPQRGCLLRETERVVLPLVGDGVNEPKLVPRMGNFHVTNVSPDQSWVTVGETTPAKKWQGDLLLGRIFWNKKNRLV